MIFARETMSQPAPRYKRCPRGLIRDKLTGQCVRPIRLVRSIEELIAGAVTMEQWRTWYEDSYGVIEEIFGPDTEVFIRVLAATSPNTSVKSNVTLALKSFRALVTGGSFEGLKAHIDNLERIRRGEDLQGPKVSPFALALSGDPDAVVIDLHMAQLLFGTTKPTKRQVRRAQQLVLKIASALGWQPRQTQAALWAYNLTLREEPVTSFEAVLLERADKVRTLLEELRKHQAQAATGQIGFATQGELEPVDSDVLDGEIVLDDGDELPIVIALGADAAEVRQALIELLEAEEQAYQDAALFAAALDEAAPRMRTFDLVLDVVETVVPPVLVVGAATFLSHRLR